MAADFGQNISLSQLRIHRKIYLAWSLRPMLRSGKRFIAVLILIAVTGSVTSVLESEAAFGAGQAPVNWSFYEYGSSNANMHTLGCNQAQYDNGVGHNSFVILDFGAMYDSAGDQINFSGQVQTPAKVGQLGENFALGYTDCGPRFRVTIAIGTNNSRQLTYAEGQAFANTVNVIRTWVNGNASHVAVWGANDIESWGGGGISPTQTYNWYNGYAASNGPTYVNFGSADGCPQNTSGSCSYGWGQGDYYNLSWRETLAFAAPEIYVYPNNPVQALQWAYISSYGAPFAGQISPMGPLDENDLDPSTNSPTAAWNQLQFFLSGSVYSMEMHTTT